MANSNATSAAKGDSKHLAYQDCVWIQLVLMYQYNLAWLTASGTSLYHRNLLAYSFLRACQEIGVLFHHFDVCGKERLPVNEELAEQAGFGLQNAMQYLLRHSEWLPDGKGELKGKNHFLFMCRSDLTMMFHAVANNYRELGEPRAPGRNLSLAEQENWMVQNLWETVQILQHQGSCLDKKFGWVYPMCLAEEMDLLNFTFLLVGPEATAPVPWPLRQEWGLQVPAAPNSIPENSFLGRGQASSHHHCKQGTTGPLQYTLTVWYE